MIEELLLFAKRCIACMLVMMHLTKAIPVSSNHLAFVGTFASHVGISWCFTTKGMKLGRSQSSVMHSEPSKQSSLLMGKHFWIKNPLQRSNSMNVRNILRPYEGAQTRSLTRRSMQVEESTPSQLGSKKYQVDSAELLPMHEKLRYGVLPNGLRYCIFPNKKPAGRFYVNLEVHAGSVDEEEEQQGIAHFVEHGLFLGTERFKSQKAMKKLLRRLGMAYNADANAFTDFRSTVYTLSAPTKGRAETMHSAAGLFGDSGVSTAPREDLAEDEFAGDDEVSEIEGLQATTDDNTQLVLELLHQMAFKALLKQEDIDKERGAILSELKDRNSISQRAAMEFYRFNHNDTVLPRRFPIGKEEQVKRFSSEDLRRFYKRHYYPANMCLYVAGDVDPADFEKKIQAVFGKEQAAPADGSAGVEPVEEDRKVEPVLWPRRGAKIVHHDLIESLDPAPAIIRTSPGVNVVSVPAAQPPSKEHGSSNKFHVLSHSLITDFSVSFCAKGNLQTFATLSDMRESVLDSLVGMILEFRVNERRLRSNDPIFNGIGWTYSSSARDGCSMNSFSISSQPRHWKAALEIGLQEAARMAEHGVTEAELSQAVTTLVNHFAQQATLKNSLESSVWMRRIMECVQAGDQVMNAEKKFEILAEISSRLTPKELSVRARELFNAVTSYVTNDQCKAFICMPDNSPDMQDFSHDLFLTIVERGLKDPNPPESLQVPERLLDESHLNELVDQMKPAIVSRRVDEEGGTGVVVLKLSNGIRVAYRTNDSRPKEFRVRISAAGGRVLEDEQRQGQAVAASALWVNGGCGGYAAEVVSRFASMWGLSYDAACNSEELHFDMLVQATVDGALERAMGLVWMFLQRPNLDQKALERFKIRVRRASQSLDKSVERKTSKLFLDMMISPEHAWRLQELRPEIADSLDVEDVRAILFKQIATENLEMVVSGDFDPQELEKALVRYMGTLHREQEKPFLDEMQEVTSDEAQRPLKRVQQKLRLKFKGGSMKANAEHLGSLLHLSCRV
mmetsp:Transcript_20105/g.66901  ORF Transcript_20105/g.66901 Transcript_20105/m.66901 type:complete len:1016 (-) Transcript_20105:2956-6003(-)